MLEFLFKPKWQHKSPDIRIKALLKLLGNDAIVIQLALQDDIKNVREAAIQHLTHLPTLLAIAKQKNTESSIALNCLQERLLIMPPDTEGLGDALIFLDNEKICTQLILTNNQSLETRIKLLEKVFDEGLLRQIKNKSKQNKRIQQAVRQRLQDIQAEQKITQAVEQLCQKIDLLQKEKDPKIAKDQLQALTQKYTQQLEAANNTLKEQYQLACDKTKQIIQVLEVEEATLAPSRKAYKGVIQSQKTLLKQLQDSPFQHTQQSIKEALDLLQQAWTETEPLPDNEERQFQRDFNTLQNQLKGLQSKLAKDLSKAQKLQKLLSKAKKLSQQTEAVSQTTFLTLQNNWQKAPKLAQFHNLESEYKNYAEHIEKKITQQENQKENKINVILQNLEKTEKALEADQLEAASKAFYQCQKAFKNTPDIEKKCYDDIKTRLAIASPQITEMKKWRHWGTDQARQNLIQEVQILVDDESLLIADRAKKISLCRQQWKKFDHMDGTGSNELWLTFDKLCNSAYEPCEQHYKVQADERQKNLKKRQDICLQLEELEANTDWKNPLWRELDKQIKKIGRDWKKAGTVDRKTWQKINARFNQINKTLDQHLEQERRHNWMQREALLEQILALAELEDLEEAKNQATLLRRQWKTTVTEKTRKEQQLWKAFQAALDAVDKRLEDKKQAADQALEDNLQAKKVVCEKIEQLSKNTDFLKQKGQLIELEKAFYDIAPVANFNRKKINSQFEKCLEQAHQQYALLEKQRQNDQLKLLQQKGDLCSEIELNPESEVDQQWQALPTLVDTKLEQQMQQRFQQKQQANEEILLEKQQLCLDLEILLKIESPTAFKQARMQRQVELLDQQMRQRADEKEWQTEVNQKIRQWFNLAAVNKDNQTTLETRFNSIFQTIIGD